MVLSKGARFWYSTKQNTKSRNLVRRTFFPPHPPLLPYVREKGPENEVAKNRCFPVLKIPLDLKWRYIWISFLFYSQNCIVMTDGLSNDRKRLERTSKELKKIAKVIAVGVRGKNYSKAQRKKQEEELKMIATDKNKDFFLKDSFEKLRKEVDPIAKRACPLTYRKKGP